MLRLDFIQMYNNRFGKAFSSLLIVILESKKQISPFYVILIVPEHCHWIYLKYLLQGVEVKHGHKS